jgi:hypothetical protein
MVYANEADPAARNVNPGTRHEFACKDYLNSEETKKFPAKIPVNY